MDNIEALYSKPLSSTRSGAFYNTFPYPTKISPEAIAVYIACTTEPGALVLDSFAGSGSTGIAALLCEYPTKRMKEIAKELNVTPVWGARNATLYEIGTYASFAIKTILSRITSCEFIEATDGFLNKAQELIGELYKVTDPTGSIGTIRYVIWSEVLVCPSCHAEILYFEHGTSRNPVQFKDEIVCPYCKKAHRIDEMPFATEEYYDKLLQREVSRKKRVPAWIYGTTKGCNWDRQATEADVVRVAEIEHNYTLNDTPQKIQWGELHRAGYHSWVHCAQKKGYSGVGLWSKVEPENVVIGFDGGEFDDEGRYVQADFKNLSIVSVYFPSGSSSDDRQLAKYRFLDAFEKHMEKLQASGRDILICGDVNIAHKEIDLKNWKGNLKNSGFLPEERQWVTDRLECDGWHDIFRELEPGAEQYTWWSQRGQARAKNVGWRIDYMFGTEGIARDARSTFIYKDEKFSDHAPLVIDFEREI